MPKSYPEEFKLQVVKNYEAGDSIAALSKKHKIAQTTLYRWIKDYSSRNSREAIPSLSAYNTAVRRFERMERILQVIRLSNIIDDVPLRKRLEILASLHEQFDKYSVHELCEALDVSRGTFYNHIFRKADRTKYMQEQEALMLQVQQIFDNSEQRYGAEKIRVILSENGIHVGRKRIRAVMQELGLESIRCNAKRNYDKQKKDLKKNLIKYSFTAERDNQYWVSDITYFKIGEYGIHLCVIIDLFSRKVVGYNISRKSSTHLVTSSFRKAFDSRGQPQGLIFHSDRGSQYIADAFKKLLLQANVKQSFSATARPLDNAVAETFFATFKKEEAYRRHYSSERDFRKSVDKYIQFYNEVRPHQTLSYKTPKRFEELYAPGGRDS